MLTAGIIANMPQSAASLSNEEYLFDSSIQWFQNVDCIFKKLKGLKNQPCLHDG
jgi:hypothetical protein